MFGLEGVAVPLGFALTILSALACVVYGVLNWNRGHYPEEARPRRAGRGEG
ncbi:symporter small accessory protein [Geoalkalibacter halelectricus]|uniref:Uncharacterized protein n=1 Tax=Geoalkalibacter halelectricus TaxID=2847045 RepID=A0ABY5ZIZ2_9BACT|nr:symporter small accessory protein [Geoalkalibacter halelectricus]MDO3378939.1 hypothetical protein [Geoalkalibacter halelectricus]UWZ79038.1 hypothetical protein L9S41_15335 [Geoalkalibacter halelectricus]